MPDFSPAIWNKPAAAAPAAYTVENSLKFDGSSSYLSRTFGTPTNAKKWTFSAWVKRSDLSTGYILFSAQSGSSHESIYWSNSDNTLWYNSWDGSSSSRQRATSAVYRDPSAWYHILVSVNTDQASPEIKLWVNGEEPTTTDATPVQDDTDLINSSGTTHYISDADGNVAGVMDGYVADVHFWDGQVKTPSDMTETDSNGQLVPIEYSGSDYGDNGFHLDFSDSSDLGADAAGSNDFTATNLGSHDQMGDSPFSGKNYATLNPLDEWADDGVFAEGNSSFSTDNALGRGVATIRPSSGKWYGEVYITDYQRFNIGVQNETGANSMQGGATANSAILNYLGGTYWNTSSTSSYVSALANGNIVSFALDLDNDILWFAVNGTWAQSVSVSAIEAGTTTDSFTDFIGSTVPVTGDNIGMFVESNSTSQDMGCIVNFGQDPTFNGNRGTTPATAEFAYTPPSGFKSLCTANLPDPGLNNAVDAEKAFAVSTWTGTYDFDNSVGTEEQNIDIGFHPGVVWVKDREGLLASYSSYSTSGGHWLFDEIQGAGYAIDPSGDQDEAESRSDNTLISTEDGISSFAYTSGSAKGFTVDAPETNANVDTDANGSPDNAESYVGWAWRLGSTGGTGTEKYNADAGISVVKWSGTGDGDDDLSVSHSLGAAPEMVWVSDLSAYGGMGLVAVWHKDLTADYYLDMATATAEAANTVDGFSWYFQNPPNGSTTLDVTGYLNYSGYDYHAYLFRSIEGYSKVGSYTGNSSADGPFVYCGFRPAFLIIKVNDTYHWVMIDSARDTYNVIGGTPGEGGALFPSSSQDEYPSSSESAYPTVDFLSNGFKVRTAGLTYNGSSSVELHFYAVAEIPTKFANAR